MKISLARGKAGAHPDQYDEFIRDNKYPDRFEPDHSIEQNWLRRYSDLNDAIRQEEALSGDDVS